MIVPTMKWDELREEFFEDLRIVQARAKHQYKVYQQKLIRQKLNQALFTEPYISSNRNHWLCFYDVSRDDSQCFHLQCCTYYDHVGLKTLSMVNASEPVQEVIIRLNSHFYNRYNERMELQLVKPEQMVKHFYRNNFRRHHDLNNLRREVNGDQRIFMPAQDGVMLGFRDIEKELIEMKTFISYDMLKGQQIDDVKFLRDYNEDNLNQDNFE